jgi:hypothetical protein
MMNQFFSVFLKKVLRPFCEERLMLDSEILRQSFIVNFIRSDIALFEIIMEFAKVRGLFKEMWSTSVHRS